MTEVAQYVGRREIARRLNAIGANQNVLCRCAGIANPVLSMVLSGQRFLSEKAQIAILDALAFFEQLAADAGPVPVRFSDVETIFKLYREWQSRHAADEVVGTEEEAAAAK
jgi:hypothetical protein